MGGRSSKSQSTPPPPPPPVVKSVDSGPSSNQTSHASASGTSSTTSRISEPLAKSTSQVPHSASPTAVSASSSREPSRRQDEDKALLSELRDVTNVLNSKPAEHTSRTSRTRSPKKGHDSHRSEKERSSSSALYPPNEYDACHVKELNHAQRSPPVTESNASQNVGVSGMTERSRAQSLTNSRRTHEQQQLQVQKSPSRSKSETRSPESGDLSPQHNEVRFLPESQQRLIRKFEDEHKSSQRAEREASVRRAIVSLDMTSTIPSWKLDLMRSFDNTRFHQSSMDIDPSRVISESSTSPDISSGFGPFSSSHDRQRSPKDEHFSLVGGPSLQHSSHHATGDPVVVFNDEEEKLMESILYGS